MPQLPQSWNLKTKKRSDGKLDILGKTDAGEEYRVRTTDGPDVTSLDIQELHDADRETYRNRTDGARCFVKNLMEHSNRKSAEREGAFMDDLTEAAGPVVHAGFERKGLTVGSSWAYRRNYDSVFGEN